MSNQTNTCARCSDDCHSIRRALEIENAELREAVRELLALADSMRMTDVYLAGDMRDHARESARELLSKSKGGRMSDTPITDAALIDNADLTDWGSGKSNLVSANDMRELERQLSDLRSEVEGMKEDAERYRRMRESIVELNNYSGENPGAPTLYYLDVLTEADFDTQFDFCHPTN